MINNEKDAAVIAAKSADENYAKTGKNVAEKTDKEELKPGKNTTEEKKQYEGVARNLRSLVGTIANLIAERSAKRFVDITKNAGLENMGRVLSLMEESEPYVNVLILESVFATYGIISGVEDMEFLYWCVENAPGLFAEFKEEFMAMEDIADLIVKITEIVDDLDDPYGYTSLFYRRRKNDKNNSNM